MIFLPLARSQACHDLRDEWIQNWLVLKHTLRVIPLLLSWSFTTTSGCYILCLKHVLSRIDEEELVPIEAHDIPVALSLHAHICLLRTITRNSCTHTTHNSCIHAWFLWVNLYLTSRCESKLRLHKSHCSLSEASQRTRMPRQMSQSRFLEWVIRLQLYPMAGIHAFGYPLISSLIWLHAYVSLENSFLMHVITYITYYCDGNA